jgi:hypothetical protein
MKKELIAWTVGLALGVGLSVAGCSDKKPDSGASAPSVGQAPPSPEDKSAPDATLAPGAADYQAPSAMSKESDRERERKVPRG